MLPILLLGALAVSAQVTREATLSVRIVDAATGAAKTEAGAGQAAHTTPVYVTVNGGGFHNRDAARERLDTAAG